MVQCSIPINYEEQLPQLSLQLDTPTLKGEKKKAHASISDELRAFAEFGKPTLCVQTEVHVDDGTISVPTFVNEFWTSKQRDGHSLHEISYRACFKAELPEFFIRRFTEPGEVVYDPFLGRGTTALQASLDGRIAYGCDINPLSKVLLEPRFTPPTFEEVRQRLEGIPLTKAKDYREDLEVFFHPNTLRSICSLREYFLAKGEKNLDSVDKWIRMVAINRLTGHSQGFFSVYTLPPNQAVSIESQKKINKDRNQTPPDKDVKSLILRKTKSLLRDPTPNLRPDLVAQNIILTGDSRHTPSLPAGSVSLVVTSPPFLDVVNYAEDNWMRCWFIDIDPTKVKITMSKKLADWEAVMTSVFIELRRLLKKGGHIAFEVGEVRGGKILLEEAVVRCGLKAGLTAELILINSQVFTKTANIWGVSNSTKGTNTNRIVLFRK